MKKIFINLEEVAKKAGVENPFQLAEKTKINYAICWKLWNNQSTRISLNTFEHICDALNCEPGDLLVRGMVKKQRPVAA